MDKLESIIQDKYLWSDLETRKIKLDGTLIGMDKIKNRRLGISLTNYPSLYVGGCVPFYFCPKSIMLYILHKRNHSEMIYEGGQSPIIHLVADLKETIEWAKVNNQKWVFTDSNASSIYFNDLNKINWKAVDSSSWQQCQDEKQAEFLLEKQFPFELIKQIGVYSTV